MLREQNEASLSDTRGPRVPGKPCTHIRVLNNLYVYPGLTGGWGQAAIRLVPSTKVGAWLLGAPFQNRADGVSVKLLFN